MGFVRSLATVKRLRSRLGLRCRHKRRFVRTTDGNHSLPIAPNLLKQKFNNTDAPNQVWVTDITYVPTDEGWLYVSAIKDLFNKKIVGWATCLSLAHLACFAGAVNTQHSTCASANPPCDVSLYFDCISAPVRRIVSMA